jgi:hypothetical protein
MLFITVVMLGIILLAGLVVVYVAFPHRGEDIPAVPWVGQALRKGVDAMPTLEEVHSDRVGAHRR